MFIGPPSAVSGPYDDIVLPRDGEQPDRDLELAVVIGRTARRLEASEALDAVAGRVIVNDLTLRERVLRRYRAAHGDPFLSVRRQGSGAPPCTGPA